MGPCETIALLLTEACSLFTYSMLVSKYSRFPRVAAITYLTLGKARNVFTGTQHHQFIFLASKWAHCIVHKISPPRKPSDHINTPSSSIHPMITTPIRRIHNPATNFTSPLIALTVGTDPEGKTFHVHQAVLVSQSEYFKAAFEADRCEEGFENVICLPEDDPAALEAFIHFAYRGCISSAQSETTMKAVKRENNHAGIEAVSKELEILLECCLLGDKLLAVKFKDAAIDSIIDLIRKNWPEACWSFQDRVC